MAPALGSLRRADEWCEDLHHALLNCAFTSRTADADSDAGSSSLPVLVKILPHAGSKTLAIVIVPMQTMSPLYEGLSFRTLQRRIKATSAPSSQESDDAVFEGSTARVMDALRQSDPNKQYWVECDIGRGEATLSLHSKESSTGETFSVEFDLTALDREEGPRFLRDHILLPLMSLSSFALGSAARPEEIIDNGPPTMDALCARLFSAERTEEYRRVTQLSHGLPAASADAGTAAAAVATSEARSATTTADLNASAPSPTATSMALCKSPNREVTPVRKSPPSPDSAFKTPTHPASAAKKRRKSPPNKNDSGSDTDEDEDEDDVLVIPRAATQTPSSSSSRSSRNAPSAPSSGRSNVSGSGSGSASAASRRDDVRRQPSTTPTPIPSDTVSRTGKLMPGAGYGEYLQSGERQASFEGEGEGDETVRGAKAEAEDDEEEEEMLPSSASRPPIDETKQQDASAAAAAAGLPKLSMSPTPPTRSNSPEAATGAKDKKDAAVESAALPSPAPAPAPAPPSTARTTGTSSGRGASSYTRGLAKRKRI